MRLIAARSCTCRDGHNIRKMRSLLAFVLLLGLLFLAGENVGALRPRKLLIESRLRAPKNGETLHSTSRSDVNPSDSLLSKVRAAASSLGRHLLSSSVHPVIQETESGPHVMLPVPGYNTTYPQVKMPLIDPGTGFTVTRLVDHTELLGDYGNTLSGMSAIVYSRYSPTDPTGEYVIVCGENSTSGWIYRVSDGKMMCAIKMKPTVADKSSVRSLGEVNEIRWDYTGQHPYRFYFVGRSIAKSQGLGAEAPGMTFYYSDFNPNTMTHSTPTTIRDFSSDFPFCPQCEIMNDVEGDSSNDSRYWAWQVMDTSIGSGSLPVAIMTYDKQTNTILGVIQRSCTGVTKFPCTVVSTPATAAPYITRPNMVEMSPLGTRVIVDWDYCYPGHYDANIGTLSDAPKAFYPNFTNPIRIASDSTHSGWGWGPNGEEMFVSQNDRNDFIEAVDIKNATTAGCSVIASNSYTCGVKIYRYTILDGGSWSLGMHFGKVYDPQKKGWIVMNTYDVKSNNWAKNQNLFIKIQAYDKLNPGNNTIRFGSSYNQYYGDYRSEGSGALDFLGKNIWVTGNWGFTDGRGDVTKVQLQQDWWNQVSGIPVASSSSSSSGSSSSSSTAGTSSSSSGTSSSSSSSSTAASSSSSSTAQQSSSAASSSSASSTAADSSSSTSTSGAFSSTSESSSSTASSSSSSNTAIMSSSSTGSSSTGSEISGEMTSAEPADVTLLFIALVICFISVA